MPSTTVLRRPRRRPRRPRRELDTRAMSRLRRLPRHTVACVAVALVAISGCSTGTESTEGEPAESDLVDIGAGLHGLEGLSADVLAEGLEHVSVLATGDDGVVFAATAEFEDTGGDSVYILNGDEDPVPVIDDLHTPLGLLWHAGELYVASEERIDAYGGFDGERFAEVRNVIEFPAGVGEVNGLALDRDRLLVGISAPCDHCDPELEYSASIVGVGVDGSDPAVFASGIRAPIGLAFLPGTSDLFVTMNHRDDLDEDTPGDWLGIVTQGQDWGFPDCYGQDTTECEDLPDPVAVLDPHAAASGLTFVVEDNGDSDGVAGVTGPAALVAEWAQATVKLVTLSPSADGYTASVSDFVTGVDNPVPVLAMEDGSVLVGDWSAGVVYRITAD